MKTRIAGTGLAILICCAAYAQSPIAKPEFEVALVKPAPPPEAGRMRMSMGGGPGTSDPGRINYENVTLKMVLTKAYGVKTYQISGPAWLDSERYNITAKVPAGTTKEQLLPMLQNLLENRFKLTLHREKKELPAYALLVGKGGPKMKVSEEDTGKDVASSQAPPPPPVQGRMPVGKDGFPQMPPGAGRGGISMMMMPGRAKLAGNRMSMSRLAELLEQQLDRAVIDMTELAGNYDFTLTFEPDQSKMMGIKGAMGPMGPPPGGEGGPLNPPEGDAAPSIFTAVQEQLGLKLEPRKTAVDVLVIDHLEKAPSEN